MWQPCNPGDDICKIKSLALARVSPTLPWATMEPSGGLTISAAGPVLPASLFGCSNLFGQQNCATFASEPNIQLANVKSMGWSRRRDFNVKYAHRPLRVLKQDSCRRALQHKLPSTTLHFRPQALRAKGPAESSEASAPSHPKSHTLTFSFWSDGYVRKRSYRARSCIDARHITTMSTVRCW